MSAQDWLIAPQLWPCLLLAPGIWLLCWAFDRARERELSRQAGLRFRSLAADFDPRRRSLRRGLHAGAVSLALFAAMQPVWGPSTEAREPAPVDILVCLDASQSMLARDLSPSRFGHALQEIRALAERSRGERLGLIVFAGEPRLAVPLTRDARSFAELAELTGLESVSRGGSDLGAALDLALSVLESRRERRPAVVLLLSDGEDLGGRGASAARRCREKGLAVHTLGVGSQEGSKIVIEDGDGERFLRDREGNEVVSAMNPAALRAIAQASGGSFLEAQKGKSALAELYEQRILPMARDFSAATPRRERDSRFQWPLLLAFALWLLEAGLSERRRA